MSIETVSDVIDAYMAEVFNPHAERQRTSGDSIEYHFKTTRETWGALLVGEFKTGIKARTKAEYEKWRAAGWAPGTIRKRMSQLLTAYRYCIYEELLAPEFYPQIRLPTAGPARERALSDSEAADLFWYADQEETEPHTRLGLYLLFTGQRPSAVTALTWDLVDFENRALRFRDTEATGKRSKKRRTDVPMSDRLVALLTEAKAIAMTPYVLERHGRRVRSLYAGLKALFERAGFPDLQVRDIRRTVATIAFHELDGDLKGAANLIGDREQIADEVYVQRSAKSLLRPSQAVSNYIERVRKTA